MKKIEFGFENSTNPKGTWEGIGIKPNLLLINAEYYGAIKYEKNSFIVAKVIEDQYGRYPHLLNNFIVRPAIADLYVDGSGIIYLDQEQSLESEQIEKHLNSEQVKDKIKDSKDIFTYCNDVYPADMSFTFLTLGDTVITTSIQHDVFEEKNNALKSCRSSFSQLQQDYQLSQNNEFKR